MFYAINLERSAKRPAGRQMGGNVRDDESAGRDRDVEPHVAEDGQP